MAQSIEESLLKAVKKDDIKAFNALTEKASIGAYRLGRFPVLSLLYLYKSRKILSVYEEKFLKITSFEKLNEPVEVSKAFSAKAGKCLRLYLNEEVSPLEMLLISDNVKRLKRVYPLTKSSSAVKERLKLIYKIKYSLSVIFEGDNIIIDRRPLSYREKKNIATICLCSVLAVTLAVGIPVTAVSLIPKPVEGEVTKLNQIDFTSQKEYTLKRDIVLPENYSVGRVNCKIVGGGKKLIFNKGAAIGEFNGKLSDVTIESSGSAVITTVSETAVIENVTVNVNADITAAEGGALVALTNYGTIDGVTVNVSGKINAVAPSAESSEELIFGGIVKNNYYKVNTSAQKIYRGTVKNCTVNYSQFSLKGEAGANATFGGVAGANSGYLQDCTVSGKITADTFDVAGVCSENNGIISGSVNGAELLQTSSDKGWNPITCGIVISNAYAVEDCENRGKISAVSTCGKTEEQEGVEPVASAAGIAYLSRSAATSPYIKNCVNYGSVECSAEYRNAYAAGVCLSSSGSIEECKNIGAVTVKADNGYDTYAGGITSIAIGSVYKCVNEGAVSVNCDGTAYAGGISATSYSRISYCISSGDIAVTAESVYAGGVLGCSEVHKEVGYFGYSFAWGDVNYSISECNIKITPVNENTPTYVGGITGYIKETDIEQQRYEDGAVVSETLYFGGGVTNSYFIGKYENVTDNLYLGNIVGRCDANLYDRNSYTLDTGENRNFEENIYCQNSYKALGVSIAEDGTLVSVEDRDKGAKALTTEEIESSEEYKAILEALKNK